MAQLPAIPESYLQVSAEIRNKGSFTIPIEARKAHRLIVDVEVVSVTRNQYLNFMYNLPQGDYCNVTHWAGSAISRTDKVKYPYQRLIDWVNIEGGGILNAVGVGVVIIDTLISLGVALGLQVEETDGRAQPVWGYPTTHLKFVCPPQTQIRVTCTWYPFETVEGENDIDPQTEEPTGGGDEYGSPVENPPDDPWDGNNPASAPDPNRDPRDYDDANDPPPPPPLGPDCTRDYFIQAFITTENPDGSSGISRCDAVLRGEILSVSTKITPDGGRRIAYVLRKNCSGTTEEVNLVNAPVDPPFSLTVESVTPV